VVQEEAAHGSGSELWCDLCHWQNNIHSLISFSLLSIQS
jgi:hypothetical protein